MPIADFDKLKSTNTILGYTLTLLQKCNLMGFILINFSKLLIFKCLVLIPTC